jgi:plasmid maintenance system antidote protein VapI
MKRGRPKATGPYKTHAELVAGVLERHTKEKSMRGIAQILKVSHTTIEKIIKENRSA